MTRSTRTIHFASLFGIGPRIVSLTLVLCLALMVLHATGCTTEQKAGPAPTPPPTFTGPSFLHGTISSMATVRGYNPVFVSGYGLVVGLPGTGSSEVPTPIRRWLIDEMYRRGVGRVGFEMDSVNPAAMLDSTSTAVVTVRGVIPPAAVKGSAFDIIVEALPQSQTTSLEGGRLWTTEMARGVVNPAATFQRPMAEARGALFLDPIETDGLSRDDILELRRRAVVLAGGEVLENRRIEIILRQPSWQRSALIAEKINQRFRSDQIDVEDTAVAKNDSIIQINIPARHQYDTKRFLALVSYLFLQRGRGFEIAKADQLARVLMKNPQHAADITLAWQGLGKTALPSIRRYYRESIAPPSRNSPPPSNIPGTPGTPDTPGTSGTSQSSELVPLHLRLAALEAGSLLEDEKAVEPLIQLAAHENPEVRTTAGRLLVNLPSSLRATRALYDLLNDDDRAVRVAAYESLAANADPIIRRKIFGVRDIDGRITRGSFKFALDFVPSEKPLIYITQQSLPRIAIFSPEATFKFPLLARFWNSRLMIRGTDPASPVRVFYQPRDKPDPIIEPIAPTLANLILLLGHHTSLEEPTPGLDISYSQIVDAIYQLHRDKLLDAGLEIRRNPTIERIARISSQPADASRPEFEDPTDDTKFIDRPDLRGE